ncbi:hypothetical protein E4U14_006899 [Claviceps sp. LM454 group G7]|nr:hypothetical protein E4U14_006899 [Claviceps sp. LM454 group G7]
MTTESDDRKSQGRAGFTVVNLSVPKNASKRPSTLFPTNLTCTVIPSISTATYRKFFLISQPHSPPEG